MVSVWELRSPVLVSLRVVERLPVQRQVRKQLDCTGSPSDPVLFLAYRNHRGVLRGSGKAVLAHGRSPSGARSARLARRWVWVSVLVWAVVTLVLIATGRLGRLLEAGVL